jgi:hypothetical protein
MRGSRARCWALVVIVTAGLGLAGCSDELGHPHLALSSKAERAELVPSGELHEARFRHSATLLLDGTLLVVGGGIPGSDSELGIEPLASAELYSPLADGFQQLAARLATARAAHTATRLRDGSVLIIGGIGREGAPVPGAERYLPDSREFTPAGDLLTPRALHTATLLADGRVLVVGGSTMLAGGPALDDAEIYDPATGRFEACANSPHARADANAAALLSDGRVFLLWPGAERSELFDPATREFTPAAELPTLGRFTGMTRAEDGNLLLFTQGEAASLLFGIVVLDGEGRLVSSLYEPAWVPEHLDEEVSVTRAHGVICSDTQGLCTLSAGSPPSHELVRQTRVSGRQGHTASALSDGSVLLVGGVSSEDASLRVLSSTERVDSAQWSATPVANALPESHTATMLSDGKVLLTGGDDAALADRTALYDGRALVPAGKLLVPRSGHLCLPLLDGTALIAGGDGPAPAANEEIFDWKTGTSRDAGFRLNARGSGVALADGRFLFADRETVEIYDSKLGPPTTPMALAAPLGCARPPLARLANGRVLALGERVAVELEPSAPDALSSVTTELGESHCDSQVRVLPDGTALIVRSAPSGSFARLERYDPGPPDPAARITVLSSSTPLSARGKLFDWFERPAWLGGETLAKYDPRSSRFEPQSLRFNEASPADSAGVADVVVLADASLLSLTAHQVTRWSTSWVKPNDAACCWEFPSRAPRVLMGTERTLRAARGAALFPPTWPEGSSGSTNASAGNAPVPVWLPMRGGVAAVGTFTQWSREGARWRVPHTAFPGLGLLVLAVNGEHTALGPVEIAPSALGTSCEQAGECASAQCVDGVCCDEETCPAKSPAVDGQAGAGGQPSACEARECGDYRCSLVQDGCLTSCRSNLDCREGLVCSRSVDGTCGPPLPAARLSSGCAVGGSVAGDSSPSGVGWLVLLAGGVKRRRRNRHRATSRFGRGSGAAPPAAPATPLPR